MLLGVERVLKHCSLSNAFTLTNSAQCLARCEDGVIFYITEAEEIQNAGSQTVGPRKTTQSGTSCGKGYLPGSFLLELQLSF